MLLIPDYQPASSAGRETPNKIRRKRKNSMKSSTSAFLIGAVVCATAFIIAACGGAGTNTAANTAANKSNTAVATNTAPANTTAANTTAKTETAPAGDSVGVAECDEYIKKYEACLTKIAAKNPQVEGPMKTAFEAQRNAFKTGASTPQGKAALATTCKQAIETAKSTTSAYACEW